MLTIVTEDGSIIVTRKNAINIKFPFTLWDGEYECFSYLSFRANG